MTGRLTQRILNQSAAVRTLCCMLLFLFSYAQGVEHPADLFLQPVLSNDSLLNRIQIHIPHYPKAYNPSIIPYQDGYLLSFRYTSKCPDKFRQHFRRDLSFIGVVRLDKELKVCANTTQLLNIISYTPQFSLTAEDARLIRMGDRIFMIFNDLSLLQLSNHFAMYFAELTEEHGMLSLKGPAKPLHYANANAIEKNWSPFVYEDQLFLIYSDEPRIILEVDVETGFCRETSRMNWNWDWNFGPIRGGTPAYLVDDVFLTFFHSSFIPPNTPRKTYVMGAYTFENTPPFTPLAMTPFPLGDLTDYTEDNNSKIVFPGGMIVEENLIHIAWGKADRQIWITTFDKDKLCKSMAPCVHDR